MHESRALFFLCSMKSLVLRMCGRSVFGSLGLLTSLLLGGCGGNMAVFERG